MNCNCINRIDDLLRDKNIRLTGYSFRGSDFMPICSINTDWVDRSKAPKGQKKFCPKMYVSHCPFCGKKIPKESKKLAGL